MLTLIRYEDSICDVFVSVIDSWSCLSLCTGLLLAGLRNCLFLQCILPAVDSTMYDLGSVAECRIIPGSYSFVFSCLT